MRFNLLSLTLGIYGLVLGFFLGMVLMGAAPLTWPYNVVIGYTIGESVGLFVAFGLIRKWRLSPGPKAITAVILLIFVAAVSVRLQLLTLQVANLTMTTLN